MFVLKKILVKELLACRLIVFLLLSYLPIKTSSLDTPQLNYQKTALAEIKNSLSSSNKVSDKDFNNILKKTEKQAGTSSSKKEKARQKKSVIANNSGITNRAELAEGIALTALMGTQPQKGSRKKKK